MRTVFFFLFQIFGAKWLNLTFASVCSLMPGQKVSNYVVDAYGELVNNERIKNYFVLPSHLPKELKRFTFFSFVELLNLKWLLYPLLYQDHWILLSFQILSQRMYIFNSFPAIQPNTKELR